MSTQNLLVERQADIVTITLNRPDQRNALSRTLMVELTGVLLLRLEKLRWLEPLVRRC